MWCWAEALACATFRVVQPCAVSAQSQTAACHRYPGLPARQTRHGLVGARRAVIRGDSVKSCCRYPRQAVIRGEGDGCLRYAVRRTVAFAAPSLEDHRDEDASL